MRSLLKFTEARGENDCSEEKVRRIGQEGSFVWEQVPFLS